MGNICSCTKGRGSFHKTDNLKKNQDVTNTVTLDLLRAEEENNIEKQYEEQRDRLENELLPQDNNNNVHWGRIYDNEDAEASNIMIDLPLAEQYAVEAIRQSLIIQAVDGNDIISAAEEIHADNNIYDDNQYNGDNRETSINNMFRTPQSNNISISSSARKHSSNTDTAGLISENKITSSTVSENKITSSRLSENKITSSPKPTT